ncbi:MAG TPA: rod shape-determining protein [Chloroflexia bacterium]|nr:rod shape-determining protein [Chloroflexia bacterium]
MAATHATGRDLVLDLGTSTLRLAHVAPGQYRPPAAGDRAAIIELPALTLVDRQRHSVVAVGAPAAAVARGTLPTGVEAVRPFREGLVGAFDPAVALVRTALHQALGGERALRRLARRPRALYTLPATASDAARHITHDVLTYAGLGSGTPIAAALVAAVGLTRAAGRGATALDPLRAHLVSETSVVEALGVDAHGAGWIAQQRAPSDSDFVLALGLGDGR